MAQGLDTLCLNAYGRVEIEIREDKVIKGVSELIVSPQAGFSEDIEDYIPLLMGLGWQRDGETFFKKMKIINLEDSENV